MFFVSRTNLKIKVIQQRASAKNLTSKSYQMSVFSVDMTVKSVASKSSGGFSCTGPKPLKTIKNIHLQAASV